MQKFIFVDCCLFCYFHGFGEERLNPQKLIREKTHLVRIHLQERIFTYQDDFKYFAEINVLAILNVRNVFETFSYHGTMQILLCYYENIMNMFQRKSLKLQCKEQPVRRKKLNDSSQTHQGNFRAAFLNFLLKILA